MGIGSTHAMGMCGEEAVEDAVEKKEERRKKNERGEVESERGSTHAMGTRGEEAVEVAVEVADNNQKQTHTHNASGSGRKVGSCRCATHHQRSTMLYY